MPGRKDARHPDEELPLGFPEITNPGVASAIERPRRPMHPFEGDEHGHDRHDTIPAEEEWIDDELRPGKEHNPKRSE